MQALLKEGSTLTLAEVPIPTLQNPDDVLIRVKMAGVCRTDVAVMLNNYSHLPPSLIPGHEFSGEVVAWGETVTRFRAGERVTGHPLLPCLDCFACQQEQWKNCHTPQFLGLNCHGAFAEYLVLPERQIYRLPDRLSWQEGAYTEPVAAAMAVLKAEISPQQQGLIYGKNRIAELTRRILLTAGFPDLALYHQEMSPPQPQSLDYLIETELNPDRLQAILSWLKPGGLFVLKSRNLATLPLPMQLVLHRELRLQAVHYADFTAALELMALGQLNLESLMGKVFPLEDYPEILAQVQQGESHKLFFKIA